MARILVIEDDNEVRDYLESVLSRDGYEVVGASNGKDGVAIFQQNPVDLVITDIIMPEKDGIETITDLRRDNADVKVIAISGGERRPEGMSRNYLHSARLLGANRSMQKPIANKDLLAAIRELLA